MEPVKVLVVDDHSLFRRGIVSVLQAERGIEVVGEASDGLEAIERAESLSPDVILMDIQMPRCNGLEATRTIRERMPQTEILILTVSDKEAHLFEAIKFGAKGYLLKNAEPGELVKAIFHIARGEAIVSPEMASRLLGEFATSRKQEDRRGHAPELAPSEREKEVLQLVAEGKTNREIAEALFISENTVKTHLKNILDKLHLKNRSQAAAYATRLGLVPEVKEKD
jgi:DNA-binding NarL/FixJ family response regulator